LVERIIEGEVECCVRIETRIVSGAGHDLTMVQAEVVNGIILEFLEE